MDMLTVKKILTSSGTHNWVIDEYKASERRDIVDAINDAEMLTEMLKAKFEAMVKGTL
jgi:hypothetical protein